MATLNVALKVNRAITGATTVNANSVVIATYAYSSSTNAISAGNMGPTSIVTRYFGPGQSVPSSFTSLTPTTINTGNPYQTVTTTWTLQGGVELSNTQ